MTPNSAIKSLFAPDPNDMVEKLDKLVKVEFKISEDCKSGDKNK
jgi:hypothetical protein